MNRSPFRTVWFEPAGTIAAIAHENPGYRLFTLPIIAGFAVWPTLALFSTEGSVSESGLILSALLSFGPFAEVVQLFLGAYLIRMTGLWLGGKAGVASIQAAIAWGNVPIVALAILGVFLMMFSSFYAEFYNDPLTVDQSSIVMTIAAFLLGLQFIVVAWSMNIFLQGLAEVQGYSIRRAIANSCLAWALPVVVIAIVATATGHSEQVHGLILAGLDELIFLNE